MFADTLRIQSLPCDAAKIAVSCDIGEGRWVDMTYGELQEIVIEVQKVLLASGVAKGDRILLVSENHFKWLPVFLGIIGLGAIAVPVDGTSADQRLLAVTEDCRPRSIMVSKKFQSKMESLFPRITVPCNLVNFHFDVVAQKQKGEPTTTRSEPRPEDTATIIYTSGTTGKPKGIMLTHGALLAAIKLGVKIGRITTHDVVMAMLPFTHVFGLVDAGLVPLFLGARVVMTNSFNPLEIMQSVMKFRITYFLAVPRLAEVFAMVLRQIPAQLPPMKMIIGGASCSPDVIRSLRARGITTLFGFGMTETAGGVVMCEEGPVESVGRLFPEVEARLEGAKDGVGELQLAGAMMMSGVWGSEEQTRDAFNGKYLRTGDLAQIDQDGYLYIRGRAKDVIIPPGGVNVYPDELEARLGALPFAEEFCVFGLKEKDYEMPAVIVRPRQEFFAAHPVPSVEAFVRLELEKRAADWPECERFRRIVLCETPLPRSASQKVQRHIVHRMVSPAEAGAPSDLPTPAVVKPIDPEAFGRFQRVIAAFLNVPREEIAPERRLDTFIQLDSLGRIAMLAHLEEAFGITTKDLIGKEVADFGTLYRICSENGNMERFRDRDPASAASGLPLPPLLDYSPEALKMRQAFLQSNMLGSIKVIPRPEDPRQFVGNIEGFFGFAEIPLGLVGPLRVQGDHAQGDFYLPLATTEGALVSSVARGAQIITMSGGARVKIMADSLIRAPLFVFDNLNDLSKFADWIRSHFDAIRDAAQSTTRFGKLEDIEQFPMGTNLCLRFVYSTGDASGQNMTTIATRKAIEYILEAYSGKIVDWFLESNLSGDKKINGVNFTRNRGKRVVAEAEIPSGLIEKLLHTSVERMVRLSNLSMMTAIHAHSFGAQAHYANLLAALFIAAGQDPACVAESATGVTLLENRNGNLAISVTMPGVMVGTVGGGTRLPTQQACLQILGCDGPRKARKLAEITAAGVLAGEISLIGAMAADEFAVAHAKYGRTQK